MSSNPRIAFRLCAALLLGGLMPLCAAKPAVRCVTERAADQRWLNTFVDEYADQDFLAQAQRLEGGLTRCRGKLEARTEDGDFATLTYGFGSGARLTIRTIPGGGLIVSMEHKNGLSRPEAWLSFFRKTFASWNVDWNKGAEAENEPYALEYWRDVEGANQRALIGRDAAGRLVKLSYSVAP